MKHILLLAICFCFTNIVPAQNILPIPPDETVKSGLLPNGTAYFIVSNRYVKGMADFAVAQKTGVNTIASATRGDIVSKSETALASKPHSQSPSVQDYFVSVGTLPGKNGFVEITDNATVFKFRNVNLSQDKEVLDSALWMMMNIVGQGVRDADTLSKWYAPADQAIIVSGDIDAEEVVGKLRMLSYMTPSAESFPRAEYLWEEQDSAVVKVSSGSKKNLTTVSVSWRLQRTPREYVNTVQPVVFERYMTELGNVAEERIREQLKKCDIPVAVIETCYEGGMESFDDGRFAVTAVVAPGHWSAAVSTIASVMSSLDAGMVGISELKRAENRFFDEIEMESREHITNDRYIEKCISAFMYDAPLASKKEKVSFLYSRKLNDDVNLDLFKSIAAAALDPDRNLIIECTGPGDSLDAAQVLAVFSEAWKSPLQNPVEEQLVPYLGGVQEKVKIKSTREEHISGGTIWTLSNGLRVMYHKMPSDGVVYYSYSLSGGYGSISDLAAGEAAYLSDYLEFSRIGGVKAKVFKDVIRRQGMTMRMSVDLSKMSIEGRFAKDKTDLLVRALLTVMNDSEIDSEEFGYYLKNEELRFEDLKGSVHERIVAIDRIIGPDYRYSSVKRPGALTEGFVAKADKYMDMQASKANGGVLILVGDVDESLLKNSLMLYAGGFAVSGSSFSRPVVNYQPKSGKMLYTSDGCENSTDVVISVPMAFTAENHYASGLAVMALRMSLIREIAGEGISFTLKHEFRRYPQERLNMMLSVSDASMDIVNLTRSILDDAGSLDISDAELASYKALFKQHVSRSRENPEYWLKSMTMRHLDGKDFTTEYEAKIDAVTEDKILEILSSLNDGLRVEYITKEK